MAHFSALELHNNAHLVAVAEEAACVVCFCFKIVGIDAAGELNFFKLDGLLLLFGFLFALFAFETELAVVHNLAYGGDSLARHQNKVHTLVIRDLQRFVGAHNAKRFAIGTDQSYFLCGNLLVEQVFFLFCANS